MTYYNQWILEDQLLMGSSIPSEERYRELVNEKGVTHILDLERFCDLDFDKALVPSATVLHMYFPDNGGRRPDWFWRAGFEFALESILDGGTVFVHCQMGVNRGPSMTYGIVRYIDRLPDERTASVNELGMDPERKIAPDRDILYKAQIHAFLEREFNGPEDRR